MRLIDANALEQIITEKFKEHYGNTVYQFMRDFFAFVIRQIRKAPTIEAEPVRHGRWEVREVKTVESRFAYSECSREICAGNDYFGKPTKHISKIYPYCHCGAKMDAEVVDND